MELRCNGSKSTGNNYALVSDSGEVLLIEAGVRIIDVKKSIDFDLKNVTAIISSHYHGDHFKYFKQFLDAGIDLWYPDTDEKIDHYLARPLPEQRYVKIGSFLVRALPVVHDVKCNSFLIHHPEMGACYFATDTEYIPYTFNDLSQIILEANYSQDILDKKVLNGSLLPVVRKRIMKSHMSIDTAIGFLKANDLSKVVNIVLIHLSDGNSDAKLFSDMIVESVGKKPIIADKNIVVPLNKNPF